MFPGSTVMKQMIGFLGALAPFLHTAAIFGLNRQGAGQLVNLYGYESAFFPPTLKIASPIKPLSPTWPTHCEMYGWVNSLTVSEQFYKK